MSASRSTASSRESSRRSSRCSSPGCRRPRPRRWTGSSSRSGSRRSSASPSSRVVAAAIIYSVLKFRVAARGRVGRAADPRSHGARDRLDGDPGGARHCDLDRQRGRAREERRRGPEPAPDRRHRAAVRVEVRVPGRRRRSPPGELVLPVDRPVKLTLHSRGRDPLVLGAGVRAEVRRRSGDRDDAGDHAEPDGAVRLMCTELCGLGHATMRAHVRVVSAAAVRQVPRPAGRAGAAARLRRDGFATAGCGGCHAFTPAGTERRSARVWTRRAGRRQAARGRSSASRSSTRTPCIARGLSAGRDAEDLRQSALRRAARRARAVSGRRTEGEQVTEVATPTTPRTRRLRRGTAWSA